MRNALAANGLSVNGTGIKVGVISNNFNANGYAAANLGYGTVLPVQSSVKVLQDLAQPGSDDEGRAMMQVVHDVAPGAQLDFCTFAGAATDFANGVSGSDTAFAHAILALAADGCKVICDDIVAPDSPWFQSGVVANAIQQIEAQGVVYVSCAGNQNSAPSQGYSGAASTDPAYQSAWSSTSVNLYTPSTGTLHYSDVLSFNGSPFQAITLAAGQSCHLQMQWSQPWGAASTNLALSVSVLDGFGGGLILQGLSGDYFFFTNADNPTTPGESVNLKTSPLVNESNAASDVAQLVNSTGSTQTFYISILNLGGPDPAFVKEIAYVNGGAPGGVTLAGQNAGAIQGWHESPYQITVGAADAGNTPFYGSSTPLSEYFSASGTGEQWFFDSNGNPFNTPQPLAPVLITGVDDINTSDIVGGTNYAGIDDFFGTSCATPSVAGVAALMLQQNGNLDTFDIKNLMADSAITMAKGSVSGYGLVQADKCVAYASGLITVTNAHPVWWGTHLGDVFSFSSASLLASTVVNGLGGANTAYISAAATLHDADFGNLHQIQTLLLSGGDSVTLGSAAATAGVAGVTCVNTGGNWDAVTGSNQAVTLVGAQCSVIGGANKVTLSGNGDSASLYNTAGAWDTVNGSNGGVYLGNAQASIVGGGDVVYLIGASANSASLYNTAGNWDTVNGSKGTVYLTNAQASVVGGGDTIYFFGTAVNSVSLYSTKGVWDTVNANGGQIILTGAQASVVGGGNTIAAISGSSVSLYSTKGKWDAVNGSGQQIYLTQAQAAVAGGSNAINATAGSSMSLAGTNGNWDSVVGSSDQVILTNAQTVVSGGANVIYANSGSTVSLTNTAGAWDSVYGTAETIILKNAQAAISGGGDSVFLNGGASVSLAATGGAADNVTGSNQTLILTSAQAKLNGNGDTVYFAGNCSLAASGSSENLYFAAQLGLASISGFASSDVIHLSASDWTSFAALKSSGGLKQSGANTLISLDAANTVTLLNVQASTLSQAQFAFA